MNFSLSKKKKKGSLTFGLNNRSDKQPSKKRKKPPVASNVFGADDDSASSEEDAQDPTGRKHMNKKIAAEQKALRERALAAAKKQNPQVYDYDGAYDSFHNEEKQDSTKKAPEERKSRYIGDLLKAAKRREKERDIVYERKLARELEAEDAQADYRGKEKFVTAAYKRKLQEREKWKEEEERERLEDERNDVTKKTGGLALGSFYSNLDKNVAVGGAASKENSLNSEEEVAVAEKPPNDEKSSSGDGPGDFLAGFSKSEADDPSQTDGAASDKIEDSAHKSDMDASNTGTLTMRQIREKKVAEARDRYLERKRLAAKAGPTARTWDFASAEMMPQ